MPIEWTAHPQTRRVDARGSGSVSAADWMGFIESMHEGGIRSYAKILDLSQASIDINPAQFRDIARRVNELAEDGGSRVGPAAFVIDSPVALELFMKFEDRTSTSRQMAIFSSRQPALDWLDGA